jgi:hypothetical protein
MDELVVLAEIEQSNLLLTPTVYITPVWKYALWVEHYEQTLPFMAETDNYPHVKRKVTNVIIDQEEYLTAISIEDCRTKEKSYRLEGADLYIHFTNHNPPFLFLSQKYGIINGYSNNGVFAFDDILYLPLLKDVSAITDSVDPLEYARMRFNSANYTFNNSYGEFDGISNIFGNEFNILVGKKGQVYEQYRKLIQYYISNISIDLNQASFEVKDKRERLSFKAPNTYYTKEAYPNIDDKYVDKVIQDAYGHCFGVPAVCIDEKDVYLTGHIPGEEINSNEGMKPYRSFKFARRITSLDKKLTEVQDKTGATHTVLLTQLFSKMRDDTWTQHEPYKNVAGFPDGIDYVNGIVFLESVAVFPLKDNTAYYDPTKKVYDVRADGLFTPQAVPLSVKLENGTFVPISIPQNTPGAIIIDLLAYYAGIPFHPDNYDIVEFNDEVKKLSPVGIVLDKERDIYEIIEDLQNGSLVGFQFMGKFNVFTARLDNPNRAALLDINASEILNLDEVTVDFNADLYASYTDICYGKSYTPDKDEDEYQHVINKSQRQKILDIHRLEKAYEIETLLPDEANAALKGELILEDFSEIRPVISGIKLFGFDNFNVRVYDIVFINFTMKGEEFDALPHHIARLLARLSGEQEWHTYRSGRPEYHVVRTPPSRKKITRYGRDFIGKIRCQIVNREIDPNTGIVTISVRQRDRSVLLNQL